jgi:alkylation response protein AidB-like acyl-CoA dehydrogenase
MYFGFTDDQEAIRGAIADVLRDRCTPEAVRAAAAGDGRAPGVWAHLSELGALATLAPEDRGGMGFDEVAGTLLAYEAGRVALPDPFCEQALVAVPTLFEAGREDLAGEVIAGGSLVGIGLTWDRDHEGRFIVEHALGATAFLVEAGDEMVLAEAGDVEVDSDVSVDTSLRPGRVRWNGEGERLAVNVQRVRNRSALADAALLCGLSRAMIDLSVEYVAERKQFGRPIGSFQAVQHHLADALLALTFAEPLVWRAADSMAHDREETTLHVAMAKSQASDAAERVADICLQAHGAIGYTIEADLQLFMKRAWVLARRNGSAREHRRTVLAQLTPA